MVCRRHYFGRICFITKDAWSSLKALLISFDGSRCPQDPARAVASLGAAQEVVVAGLCLNTTASLSSEAHHDGQPKVIGNKTEGALLTLVKVHRRLAFLGILGHFFVV